jgi:ubiquinone/menaquinone biosynthesis C-methylase UbiE
VGCGDGTLTDQYVGLAGSVTGVDMYDTGIKKREKPLLFTFQQSDGVNLPFADNSFEAVVSSYTLHHVEGWKQMVKEMRRVARHCALVFEPFYVPVNRERVLMRRFWDLFMEMNREAGIWHEPHLSQEDLQDFFRLSFENPEFEIIATAERCEPAEWFQRFREWLPRSKRPDYWEGQLVKLQKDLLPGEMFERDDSLLVRF